MPTSPELILKEVTTNIAKGFPLDFLTVAKNTDLSTLTWAPLVFRSPWSIALGRAHNTNVTVAGDAMHPMTPEIGQGGCSALEDAVILARCLSQARGAEHRLEKALQK
jgi:2-polyprenyl-6-methoxyphenol hydroxylase-like FAD-dependent oxidoreductase